MRNLFLVALVYLLPFKVVSQTLNCKRFRTGKFELVSKEGFKILLYRTEKKQIEINTTLDTKFIYDVVWIDDCNYKLQNKKLLKGDSKYLYVFNATIRVSILSIKGNDVVIKTLSDSEEAKPEEYTLHKIQ